MNETQIIGNILVATIVIVAVLLWFYTRTQAQEIQKELKENQKSQIIIIVPVSFFIFIEIMIVIWVVYFAPIGGTVGLILAFILKWLHSALSFFKQADHSDADEISV